MSKPEVNEAIDRLWHWIASYGHQKQPAFIADLKTVLECFDTQTPPANQPDPRVFRVTDGTRFFTCQAFRDRFVLVPEDGAAQFTTVELSWHNLRKCPAEVEQPEQWPKYWTTCDATEFAYVEQVDDSSAKYVCKDGSHIVAQWGMAELRKQLTEAEAMALIQKPEPQPAKTRVRLWMRNEPKGRPSLFSCDEQPYPGTDKYKEIHHDEHGFYTI